ncbi:MAG: hypothetical protein ABIT38_09435, partial [Gemmatimonadaceae bacterium]
MTSAVGQATKKSASWSSERVARTPRARQPASRHIVGAGSLLPNDHLTMRMSALLRVAIALAAFSTASAAQGTTTANRASASGAVRTQNTTGATHPLDPL